MTELRCCSLDDFVKAMADETRRANLVIARHAGRQTFYRANPACVSEGCVEILRRFKIL